MGSVGDSWSHGTNNIATILDTDHLVDIPYGLGNYSSYKLEFTDPSGSWYFYFVPGLGLVQDDERLDVDTPDYIYKLKSINIIPLPSAFMLAGIGTSLVGFISQRRRPID